jgi:hypothetical protein
VNSGFGILNIPFLLLRHPTCSPGRRNFGGSSVEPSRADEVLTSQLRQALALVDIKVLDHFIVTDTSIMSFSERGLI